MMFINTFGVLWCVVVLMPSRTFKVGNFVGTALSLQWHHNERDGVSNNQPHDCLLNRLLRHRLERKRQSSVSLAFVRGIHRWPVNSPHKGSVTRKMFQFDDVIMMIVRVAVNLLQMTWVIEPHKSAKNYDNLTHFKAQQSPTMHGLWHILYINGLVQKCVTQVR